MNTQRLNKVLLPFAAVISLAIGATAFAAGTGTTPHHRHHRGMRKVVAACAQASNITLPAKGSGQTLNSSDRTAIHACVQQFFADVRTCAQNEGLSKPQPGVKPSAADRAAFKQCRTSALAQISGS